MSEDTNISLSYDPLILHKKRRYSYSRIQTYEHCPKSYFWRYVLGLYPKVQTGNALQIGSITHELRDLYAKQELTNEFLANYEDWCTKKYPHHSESEVLDIATQALSLFQVFMEHDTRVPLNWVSSETHMELDTGEYVLYTRVDGLARTEDQRLWREELKTTSKLDSAYLNGLKGGVQAGIAYLVMKESVPEPVQGTCYDLLVKTKIPQCHRTFVQAERGLEQLTWDCINGVHAALEREDYHPSMSCFYYNRSCEYLSLCKGVTQHTLNTFFEKRDPFLPEPEETKEEIE